MPIVTKQRPRASFSNQKSEEIELCGETWWLVMPMTLGEPYFEIMFSYYIMEKISLKLLQGLWYTGSVIGFFSVHQGCVWLITVNNRLEHVPSSKEENPTLGGKPELVAPELQKLVEAITCNPLNLVCREEETFNSISRGDRNLETQKTFNVVKHIKQHSPSAQGSKLDVRADSGLGNSQLTCSTVTGTAQSIIDPEAVKKSSPVKQSKLQSFQDSELKLNDHHDSKTRPSSQSGSTSTAMETELPSEANKSNLSRINEEYINPTSHDTLEQSKMQSLADNKNLSTFHADETPTDSDLRVEGVHSSSSCSNTSLVGVKTSHVDTSPDLPRAETINPTVHNSGSGSVVSGETQGVVIGNVVVPLFDGFSSSSKKSTMDQCPMSPNDRIATSQDKHNVMPPQQVTSEDKGQHSNLPESKKTDAVECTVGTWQKTPLHDVDKPSTYPQSCQYGTDKPITSEQVSSVDKGELIVSLNPLHSHIKDMALIASVEPCMNSTWACPKMSDTLLSSLTHTRASKTTGHTLTVPPLHYPVVLSPSPMKEQDHLHQGVEIRGEPKPLAKRPDQYTIVEGGRKLGYIMFSCLDVILQGTYLPLPSQAALDDGIGRGGNGTITNIYFKGKEFAVKKTHFRQIEVDVMSSLRSEFILSLKAVMMGEEDPLRPHRYYCYHFYPRMSGDVQTYLNRLGQGALSNVLMKHKDSPSMLQLVVDNVKHILRCVLKGMRYLHRKDIVHNDIKPSNFLVSSPCGCDSPITCNHSQTFGIKIGDFDSAMPVAKLQTSPSLVRQLYRTHPIGTPGYRPVEYVLAGTRSGEELRWDVVTSADLWSFGCSTLKMFISHSGPSSQQEMSFLHLWGTCSYPWSVEDKRAKETLKVGLLKRVYPSWSQLWEFVEDCMKVVPTERTRADELLQHHFFSS